MNTKSYTDTKIKPGIIRRRYTKDVNNPNTAEDAIKTSNKETTVLISYNPIHGFQSGWHEGNRLFVCANDSGYATSTGEGADDFARAANVMHSISGQYYQGEVPVNNVKRYFIYAGLYAFKQALAIAKSFRSCNNAPVTVVACKCQGREKEDILSGTGIDIVWSECSGQATMGRLAKQAANINDS